MWLFYDYYYLVLVLPMILLSLAAQGLVSFTYKKYAKVLLASGRTAETITRQILDQNGLTNVRIEQISGNLTDHYDPRENVIRLSDSVRGDSSVASIGVAAHEAGHAVQHATGYAPIKWRNAVLPAANIGSKLSVPLIILGIFASLPQLVNFGILLFGLVLLFQLVTLPVEFDASRRAIQTLKNGIMSESEVLGAKKVLFAAAMTYVAAMLTTLAQLVRLVLITRRSDD